MALIARKISQETLPKGQYPLQLFKVSAKVFDNEPDKPKFEFTFIVTDGPMKGATVDCLTGQTWMKTSSKLYQVISALLGSPAPAGEFDIEQLLTKFCWGTVDAVQGLGGVPTGKDGLVAFAPMMQQAAPAPAQAAPPPAQYAPPAQQQPQYQAPPPGYQAAPPPQQYAQQPPPGYPPPQGPPPGYPPQQQYQAPQYAPPPGAPGYPDPAAQAQYPPPQAPYPPAPGGPVAPGAIPL